MQRILYADRRQKQNHKEENLLALHQELFPLKEGIGLILNQIEESNVSSSSFTTSTPRRRRSGSFLENEGKSSESIPTIDSLV